jgi:uncharacterized protein (DUF433 family)
MPKKATKEPENDKSRAVVLGRYIVMDPAICHGKLTFRGTRIFVKDILDDVATGLDFWSITEKRHGKVPPEAITEAVNLARSALFDYLPDIIEKTPVP